jgi:hypothetical protein
MRFGRLVIAPDSSGLSEYLGVRGWPRNIMGLPPQRLGAEMPGSLPGGLALSALASVLLRIPLNGA